MGYCLTHNQSYCEQMGGYCTYCGPPTSTLTYTTSGATCIHEWIKINEVTHCKKCGAIK
jgi:hypothetical protein